MPRKKKLSTSLPNALHASDTNQQIVVVTHGEGRGRTVPTGEVFLRRLRLRDPEFAARIRIHRTGDGPFDFRQAGLIVFWLGDPLRQKYPECYAEAVQIETTASLYGIRVLNSPFSLCNTSKSEQARIWNRCGLPSARGGIAESPETLPWVARQIGFPCIIRSNETHCQRKISIAQDLDEITRIGAKVEFPVAVIGLVDIRAAHRAVSPGSKSLFSRYHHKARAFVFGNDVMASHLFFAQERIVGLSNSTFAREDTPRRNLARRFGYHRAMLNEQIEADLNYFHAPIPYADTLVKAVAALGLDFAAVDYSILPDGRPVIWEANPFFHLPDGKESVLSAERQAVARVDKSFDWMARHLKAALTSATAAAPEWPAPEQSLYSAAL